MEPWKAPTLPRLLCAAAETYGSASAIEDGDVRLDFNGLAAAAGEASRAFLAAGVAHGDRIGVWAPNLHEWIVAALGLQSIGGVLVPLNTRYKAMEAGYILRKSRARLLCTVGEFLGANYADSLADEQLPDLEAVVTFRGDSQRGTAWADFLAAGSDVSEAQVQERADAVSPDDLSDILFTSGTTGNPKGVMTCHGQNIPCFATWSELLGLRAGDRYLIVNPFSHAFGYKAGWLACLMRGATALPHPVFDVPQVLARTAAEKVSVLPGPPTIFQTILAHPERDRFDFSSLRLATIGGAAIPVELIQRMRDELGFETVLSAYGLTEACGIVSMCSRDDDAETIATTSGGAIPGMEIRCVDADGKEVPRGEAGEVTVRGFNVMRGYFEDPAATAEAIDAEGWLHTGDVAVMDERGYLRITDRIKDMFIMGGFNCYPAEIEGLLFRHEGIAQAAVVGVPDERMGEVGMAFVLPVAGAELTPEAVIAWCREHMANFKVPRFVEIVDELPVNAAGKVMKFKLRERAQAGLGS